MYVLVVLQLTYFSEILFTSWQHDASLTADFPEGVPTSQPKPYMPMIKDHFNKERYRETQFANV